MYKCPTCKGKGEYFNSRDFELTECNICGGSGEVETDIFCAKCGSHEYVCECEEPILRKHEGLEDIDEDEPEDDEDIEEYSDEETEEDY